MSGAEDLKNGTVTRKDALKEKERLRREIRRELDTEERLASATAPPDILTLRERLSRPRPAVKWRISQLQAAGHRVLLAAQFKAGKTTLAANLARSVLDGDPFLATYDVAAIDGTLALFDFEMSATQLDDWYCAQRITHDDRLLVIPMRGAASAFDIANPEVRARWVALLKSHKVAYLILDCLRPVLDALGLNEHTEVGLFLTALDELLREAGIPEALVIQHMGHNKERARGDSRLLDWPDVGWTLVRGDDEDPASPRFFKAYGRDVDVPETQLAYDDVTRRLAVVGAEDGGGSRANAKAGAALKDVCEFVARAGEPPSGRQVYENVKVHGHTQKALRQAIKKGVETGVLLEDTGKNGGAAYRCAFADRPDWIPTLLSDEVPK